MTIYCDTSLLIAALVHEPRTGDVQPWFGSRPAGSLFVSDWSLTEVSSALSIKVRANRLTLENRARVLAKWTTMREESLIVLPVLPAHFAAAATYVERPDLVLRAGDALHLAVAAANGHSFATLDEGRGKAAIELGIPREMV